MSGRKRALAIAAGLTVGLVPGVVLAGDAQAITTTRVAIRANHSIYTSGQEVRLGVHLVGAPHGHVTYYQTVPGHSAHVIYTGSVDSSGYEHIYGPSKYNATFTVKYAGDATHAAAQASTRVKVRAKVAARASGGTKHGKYRTYGAGKRANLAAAAAPAKAGKRMYFPLQRLTKHGHWKTVVRHSYKLNRKGAVAIYFKGRSGHKYRLRAEYHGDRVNASNRTSWKYAKFRG